MHRGLSTPVVKKTDKLKLDDDGELVVIYHKECPDGFGSALAINLYIEQYCPTKIVTYYPAAHGSRFSLDTTGKNIIICDFSFRKDILLTMINKALNLLIIDHHKSAEKDLESIPDRYKIFDMNHSGAILTWNYLFPDKEPPLLLKYIEDRDIWTKKLQDTDAFHAWFSTIPYDFNMYKKFLDDSILLNMIQTEGRAFLKLNMFYISKASNFVTIKFMKINEKYYFVAYLNATFLQSDIGNNIFSIKPYIDFSAVFSVRNNDSTGFSLRSVETAVDVSEIASFVGGGGHRNAAGIGVQRVTSTIPGKVIDDGALYPNLETIYFDSIIVNSEELIIVYMNSSVHQMELGSYLLQTKYVNKHGVEIQSANAISCIMQNDDSSQYESMKRVDLAAIWRYDGTSNHTEYQIIFDNSLSEDKRKTVKQMLSLDDDNRVKYKGSLNYLEY